METGRPGARQTAYRILAASSPELLQAGDADLWDSGKIAVRPVGARSLCREEAGFTPAGPLEGDGLG